MVNHGAGTVEMEHGGDSHRGDARPGPGEGWFAVYVQDDGLAAGCEVDSGADGLVPPVAVEAVVAQASDDSGGGDQPGPDATGKACSPGLADGVQLWLKVTGTSAHTFSSGSSTTPTR